MILVCSIFPISRGNLNYERAIEVWHPAGVPHDKGIELVKVKFIRSTLDALLNLVEREDAENELLGNSDALNETTTAHCAQTTFKLFQQLS